MLNAFNIVIEESTEWLKSFNALKSYRRMKGTSNALKTYPIANKIIDTYLYMTINSLGQFQA